ncbi:MAG: AbrB/MazE/SpoVT family DNA-binding domain-containing protein, partial [Betaproteobacteria bacterium]|nr:AbrB/MazE/SpoVT family DNA-binding domain-containing protein [Betaproteobacteria bacterium]
MPVNSLAVRDRGQVTLPKKLRDSLQLEKGDALRGVRVGDAIVLIPQRMELDNLR